MLKLPKLPTVGKSIPQIATQMFGNPSNFRELYDKYGVTPFDPQSKLNKLQALIDVDQAEKTVGQITNNINDLVTQVNKTVNDIASLDWLMN